MDGSRDVAGLTRSLRRSHPGIDRASVEQAVRQLHSIGVVEDTPPEAEGGHRTKSASRYRANYEFFALAGLGTDRSSVEAQRRVSQSRVTVLGVGGVGGAVATSLVAAGVGEVRLVDGDRVELSNLNRQTLFRTRDVGRPKAAVASKALRSLNPEVRFRYDRRQVQRPSDLSPLIRGCDLFVLGADQPHEILQWTNRAAYRVGCAWLECGYVGASGVVSLFVPGKTPCLRCQAEHLRLQERRRGTGGGKYLLPEIGTNAVVASTAGIVGHFAALQALCYLAGLPYPARGRMISLNLWRPEHTLSLRIPFWPRCPICGPRSRWARPGRRVAGRNAEDTPPSRRVKRRPGRRRASG
jgi:molybdopterin/thiamine biosynthesis adenylyltransferase